MAKARSVELAGAILFASAVAAMGSNLAFAQQSTSNGLFPPCQVEDKTYICTNYLGLAQMIGAILVACVVAVAVGLGAYGRRYHAAVYA